MCDDNSDYDSRSLLPLPITAIIVIIGLKSRDCLENNGDLTWFSITTDIELISWLFGEIGDFGDYNNHGDFRDYLNHGALIAHFLSRLKCSGRSHKSDKRCARNLKCN